MSSAILNDAVHVLQHQQRLSSGFSFRLFILVKHRCGDAEGHESDQERRNKALHQSLCSLRERQSDSGSALAIGRGTRVSTRLGGHVDRIFVLDEHRCRCTGLRTAAAFAGQLSARILSEPVYRVHRTWPMQHLLDRLLVLAVGDRTVRPVPNARADGAEKRRSHQQGVQMSGLQTTQADHRTPRGLQKAKVALVGV